MSEIEWKHFEDDDVWNIHLRPHEQMLLNRGYLITVPTFKNSGLWTLLYEGNILAFIGYFEKWDSVYQVFVIPSVYTTRCRRKYLQAVKQHLENLKPVTRYHRLQTESWDDPITNHWMEFLGFTCEGTLKQFAADKSDYKMWAITQ